MRGPVSDGRRDYWLPLALIGFLLLAALAFAPREDFGWFAYAPQGENVAVAQLYAYTGDQGLVALESPQPFTAFGDWPVGALLVFALTVAWYVFRAKPRPSPWRVALLVAGGIAAIMVLSIFGAASWSLIDESGFVTTFVLPLGGLGLLGLAWAYFGTGRGRTVAGWLGGVLAGLAASMLLAMALPGMDDLLVYTAGLLVLAWLERSLLLVVITVAAVVGSLEVIPAPPGLVPGLVLLAGAIAALVTRRGQWRGERPADTA
ncbi:hypothetical protein [Amycolatopsis albispora]|uniref:Uncharacterized protein n=1 Tax=Amycolatopsis albispora TaxID=1804986 RepID=A0A344L792_9PSEU|nr:hypothetical protein [Amycolatopsis albispora]AXB43916.1 hypothetical protein A4R43_16445 [Amycolatopsis albispora]